MKRNRGITLIALVVTIVVLLILAGISISMLGGENGIITKAQEAKEENRGGTVEERRDLWKVNQVSDKTTNSSTAQTLDELLSDLENEGLLTSEEVAIIKDVGIITIGSHVIDFTDGEIDWSKMQPGLYETGTRNMIKSWEELKNEGYISVENYKLVSISSSIPEGDLIISSDITELSSYGDFCGEAITTSIIGLYVPGNVKEIPQSAFGLFNKLKKVILEDGIESIGWAAFCNCNSLIDIKISNSLVNIEDMAFFGCASLTSIEIPNGVTSIGNNAFWSCSRLTNIEIPSSVTSIGDGAFCGCSSLKNIKVDTNNVVYDSRENCNAIIKTSTNELIQGCKNTIIPNSVISIGFEAFSYNIGLTDIEIPNSVTSIGNGAFYGCNSLTTIKIPNSVTSIRYGTFSRCSSLTNIEIPNNVISIEDSAFEDCSSLITVNYAGTRVEWNTLLSSISGGNDNLINAKIICTDGEIN